MKISKCLTNGNTLYFIQEYKLITDTNFYEHDVADYFPTKLSFFGYMNQILERETEKLNDGKYNGILNIHTKKRIYYKSLTDEQINKFRNDYEQYCKSFIEPYPIESISVEEKNIFWDLVGKLRYNKNNLDECKKIFNSECELKALKRSRMIEIFDLLRKKLFNKLDLEYFYDPFFKEAYQINPNAGGDDDFSDFVCQIISKGPFFYYRALEEPISATQISVKESFCYIFQ